MIDNNLRRYTSISAGLIVGFLFLYAISVQAAPIVSGGQLIDAANVKFNGRPYYNVQFLNGSCEAMHASCKATPGFTFSTLTTSSSASTVLLEKVFLDGKDPFNSDSSLTGRDLDNSDGFIRKEYGINRNSVIDRTVDISVLYIIFDGDQCVRSGVYRIGHRDN